MSHETAVKATPTSNIELCEDGKYRWIYEFQMLKNPVLLFTIWKILILVFGGVGLFVLLISLRDILSYNDYKDILGIVRVFVTLITVFLVLGAIAYLILAAVYGGHYIVLFEMDEKGVRHIQQPKQFTKAQGIAWMASFARAAGGNPIAGIGQGLLISSNNEKNTTFDAVRSVRVMRTFRTIKVNELINRNQVYAEPGDFDFVTDFILSHVPQTAKRR